MYNRLKSYLELNEFLYNGQYGFRENMSTRHAIVDIVNSIQNNMDNKLFTLLKNYVVALLRNADS